MSGELKEKLPELDSLTDALWQAEILKSLLSVLTYLECDEHYPKERVKEELLKIVSFHLLDFDRFRDQWLKS